MTDYRIDTRAWALEQAEAIQRRSPNEVDWENVAEEIRSLGSQIEWELYNRLTVILTHLLKWRYQAPRRTRSWTNTLAEQRREVARLLRKNPSLKSVQHEEFEEAYTTSRSRASRQTRHPIESFPEASPFTLAQALDPDWLPDAAE